MLNYIDYSGAIRKFLVRKMLYDSDSKKPPATSRFRGAPFVCARSSRQPRVA
jgi:hypothetical protein